MRRSLIVMAFLTAIPAYAQSRGAVDKGSVLVGGSASIRRSTTEVGSSEITTTGVAMNPSLLFFVAPRFAVGGELALSRISFEGGSGSAWQVGPAARLYFAPSSSRTLPYVGARVTMGNATTENDVTNAKSTSDAWGMEGVVGLTVMVSRQVGITSEGFVSRTNDESGSGTTSLEQKRTDIGLRFGFAAFIFR